MHDARLAKLIGDPPPSARNDLPAGSMGVVKINQ
jgi:hypothetical protein